MFSRPRLSNHNRKGNDDSPPQHVDVLSSKLNDLTTEERSSGLHDLHGVADQVSENPEMLHAKIYGMTKHLQTLSSTSSPSGAKGVGSAYKQALELSPKYVEGLKLRFLRAERYNSQDAAARMIRFFDRKLELFGEESLVRDLIFSKDLTKEEQQAIQDGLVQLLPQRDRAGRTAVFASGRMHDVYPDTQLVTRCVFYFLLAASKDKESQLNGTIGIYYGIGQKKTCPDRAAQYRTTWFCIPFRVVAIHYCKDSSLLDGTIKFIHKTFESQSLCRMRLHMGTDMECIYNLMTFGIPREAIPVCDDGNLKLEYHHQILQSLRYREEQTLAASCQSEVEPSPVDAATDVQQGGTACCTATATALVPGPNDVWMGRGRHPKTCTGALRLRNLLLEHQDEYEATPRAEKARIAEKVVEKMKKSGSRFLKFTPGGFIECEDSVAREKISHGFRNLRTKNKKGGGSTSADGTRGTTTTPTPKARKRTLH